MYLAVCIVVGSAFGRNSMALGSEKLFQNNKKTKARCSHVALVPVLEVWPCEKSQMLTMHTSMRPQDQIPDT